MGFATGVRRTEARDAAKRPIIQRTAPHTKGSSAQMSVVQRLRCPALNPILMSPFFRKKRLGAHRSGEEVGAGIGRISDHVMGGGDNSKGRDSLRSVERTQQERHLCSISDVCPGCWYGEHP